MVAAFSQLLPLCKHSESAEKALSCTFACNIGTVLKAIFRRGAEHFITLFETGLYSSFYHNF